MGRRDEFEDDGRTVADMSDLAGIGLFGRHSSAWQSAPKGDRREEAGGGGDSGAGKKPWEDTPFTWRERMRYIVMALGAAFLIGAVLLGGVAAVIWLFVLYD